MRITGTGITPQAVVFAIAVAAAAIAGIVPDMSMWPGAAMATFGCSGAGMSSGTTDMSRTIGI
jgi:hypothetical protein